MSDEPRSSRLIAHEQDLALAHRCLGGEVAAWEEFVERLNRPVHTLAVRFLWSVQDADDVTQEVLLKVFTRLAQYRGEAALTTWVYRIAARHLSDLARRPSEDLTFAVGREHLLAGLVEPAWSGPEEAMLAEEVKIGCTTSMLTCLSRPLRLSYVLGVVLDLPGPEAAWVLDVDPATHRKRLQLARGQVRDFLDGICGLYRADNPCRCRRQVTYDVRIGRIDPGAPSFSTAVAPGQVRVAVREMDVLLDDLAIMRSNPDTQPGPAVLEHLRALIRRPGPATFR